MIPRQKQHDNEWVRATDEALLRVCERWGARVGFKQRIADVLRLERNNSSFEEGRYALQSHFDLWSGGKEPRSSQWSSTRATTARTPGSRSATR